MKKEGGPNMLVCIQYFGLHTYDAHPPGHTAAVSCIIRIRAHGMELYMIHAAHNAQIQLT